MAERLTGQSINWVLELPVSGFKVQHRIYGTQSFGRGMACQPRYRPAPGRPKSEAARPAVEKTQRPLTSTLASSVEEKPPDDGLTQPDRWHAVIAVSHELLVLLV